MDDGSADELAPRDATRGWAIACRAPRARESIVVHAVSASAEALRIFDIKSLGKLKRMAPRPSAFPTLKRARRLVEGERAGVRIGRDFIALVPFVVVARDSGPTTTRHLAEIGANGVALALCRPIIPAPYRPAADVTMGPASRATACAPTRCRSRPPPNAPSRSCRTSRASRARRSV